MPVYLQRARPRFSTQPTDEPRGVLVGEGWALEHDMYRRSLLAREGELLAGEMVWSPKSGGWFLAAGTREMIYDQWARRMVLSAGGTGRHSQDCNEFTGCSCIDFGDWLAKGVAALL